jgi:hypothetical protein
MVNRRSAGGKSKTGGIRHVLTVQIAVLFIVGRGAPIPSQAATPAA